MKNNNVTTSIFALLLIVIVPAIFFLSGAIGSVLTTVAPLLSVLVIAVVAAIFTGYTSTLFWEFLDEKPPIIRWLPCYGELTLMETRFLIVGSVFYALAIVFFLLSRLPYTVFSFLGTSLALNMPFYLMLIAFVFLIAVQIVKGVGLINCTSNIMAIWEERIGTDAGAIKRFAFFGFIPFVRIIAIYALNKPLSTMVTFMEETISDQGDVALSEED